MLMIPIAALIFIGGSYFLANRFLPPNVASKAMPWMAATAFLSYFATQFAVGIVLALMGFHAGNLSVPLLIGVSLMGSLGGAWLVLNGFVRRHRRRKAEKAADATVF